MDTIEEIKRLAALLKDGAITQKEFDSLKKNVLASINQPATPNKNIENTEVTQKSEIIKQEFVPKPKISAQNKKIQDSESAEEQNIHAKRGHVKKKVTQKQAFDMLYKMDVGVVQQNIIYHSQVGDFNKVELLLIAGIDPNISWYNEQLGRNVYALHNTAGFGKPEMVKFLLDNGAEVNLRDNIGYTALFYAIDNGKAETIKVLIENGADFNHKANDKMTPLNYARKQKKQEIVELLINAGAEEIIDPEPKLSNRKKGNGIKPNDPYSVKNSLSKNDLNAKYIMYATIALIVIMSIIAGVKGNNSTPTAVMLGFFIPAYFLTYIIFKRSYSKLRSSILLTIIPIIVTIGLILPTDASQQSQSSSCAGSDAYKDGYASGYTCRAMGESTDCATYVEKHNEETGRNTLQASDCFCEGFNDGISGASEK
jgi:hypothetical protein